MTEIAWLRSLHTAGTQEAPRRHPRRHPGGSQGTKEARGALEAKCAKTMVFYRRKSRDLPFRCRGAKVTLTVCDACAEKLVAILPRISSPATGLTLDRENPYSRELFGEYIYTYIYIYI